MSDYRLFYRRNLPHYQPEGATIFTTFRLAGSLPKQVMARLRFEANRIDFYSDELTDSHQRKAYLYNAQKQLFARWDKAIEESNCGHFWLQEPEVAQIVADSIHYRDQNIYRLDAFCIMPNHVHLLFKPLCNADGKYHSISDIMHSLKLYTANRANPLLNRQGQFWQHESYDHVVRDASEHDGILRYILSNPVKAGLATCWKEWPWSYSRFNR